MHFRAEVGEDRGRRVQQIVEDLDDTALFPDEDLAVAGKAHRRRLAQAAERDLVGECTTGRWWGRLARARDEHEHGRQRDVDHANRPL